MCILFDVFFVTNPMPIVVLLLLFFMYLLLLSPLLVIFLLVSYFHRTEKYAQISNQLLNSRKHISNNAVWVRLTDALLRVCMYYHFIIILLQKHALGTIIILMDIYRKYYSSIVVINIIKVQIRASCELCLIYISSSWPTPQ